MGAGRGGGDSSPCESPVAGQSDRDGTSGFIGSVGPSAKRCNERTLVPAAASASRQGQVVMPSIAVHSDLSFRRGIELPTSEASSSPHRVSAAASRPGLDECLLAKREHKGRAGQGAGIVGHHVFSLLLAMYVVK